jgi:hypothetical protein
VDTTQVSVDFVWDSAATNYINLNDSSSRIVPAIAAGQCAQVYFQVKVTPVPAAFHQSRSYHITAVDASGTASSPVPRQLYVESLLSQNRNSIEEFYLDGVLVPTGGSINLVVGNTYSFTIKGGTATQGYEQLASYLNLPDDQFEITSISSTYSANNSPYIDGGAKPATTDMLYANACDWDANPSSQKYKTCVGGNYKTGGKTITNSYTVKVIGGAGTSAKLSAMIYDFSGSSYHYNSDFSQPITIAEIIKPDPKLTLNKTASQQLYSSLGDIINYSYLVTNTGNVSLAGPFMVSDDKLAVTTCPSSPKNLTPGASIICTGNYTITQSDIDAGSVTNIATATGGGVTSPPDTVTIYGPILVPSMSLAKTASPLLYSSVGDVITYSYFITNTGSQTLTGPMTVYDDKNAVTCPAVSVTLAPLGVITCVGTYVITQADIDAGSVTNIATARAEGTGISSLTSTATVRGPQPAPSLRLEKTASPMAYSAVGDVITYSYLLSNTGNVTLTGPFTVSDDKNAVTCPAVPATLAPLGVTTCVGTYVIKQSDIDADSLTNIATARAEGSGVTSPPVTLTIFDPKPEALLGLIKTATPLVYSRVGQEISYRYEVTNIGTVTLTGPFTVADDKNAVTCPGVPATLAPLGVTTCVGTYVITQADIDAGSVTNIATATAVGSQLTSASVSQTVTAANRPPRPSNPIPTLGEWAQALMMVLMVFASGWYGFRTKQR